MSDGKDKEKKEYPINGVDLTAHLPVPLFSQFTDKEKDAIKEFREKCAKHVKPEHTDWYLSRFLIARKWDMSKSVDLFCNAMKWREEEKIDELVETFPNDFWYDFLLSYWPTSINPDRYHYTKDGCPIIYERIGLVSPKIVDYIPLKTLFLWHVYCVELMERENNKVCEKVGFSPGNILNEDLGALATGHLTKMTTLISTISGSDEQRYPESVRKIYIVNPPGVFSMAMGLLKPFLDERTLQKFANGSPSDFTKEWKEVIGEENLPKYLGGTLDWDPPSGGNVKKLMEAKGIKPQKISLPRRGENYVKVDAKKGQTIFAQVMLKRSDVGVAIVLDKNGGDKKQYTPVLPLKKYDSEKAPHLLSAVAPEDGEYLIHLDNTDSPMMGRNVKLLHWVKDPFVPKKKEEGEKKEKKHHHHHHHKHKEEKDKEAKEAKDSKSPRHHKPKDGDDDDKKKEKKKKVEVVA